MRSHLLSRYGVINVLSFLVEFISHSFFYFLRNLRIPNRESGIVFECENSNFGSLACDLCNI